MKLWLRAANRELLAVSAGIATAFLSFLVFLPALKNNLLKGWDDGVNLIDNPYFRGFGRAQLKWMWTTHLMEHYIPLTWMSFGLDYVLWKNNSLGYHLTNILLHALNAGLLFWLALVLYKLCGPEGPNSDVSDRRRAALLLGAGFAALSFSLHPLRVESVAWATERRDMLSTAFYILAVLAYLRCFRKPQGAWPSVAKYYWLSFLLFAASLLSKEMTVTLPFALVVLDIYPLRRLGGTPADWFGPAARWVWIEKIPFLAVGLADGIMTLYVSLGHHVADTLQETSWISRVAITVYGTAFYLLKTVAPVHLSALYPLTRHKLDPAAAPFLISLTLLVGITVAAVALRRRFPAILAVWVVYIVTLLPVSGIFQNGHQIAADRYTYLPSLGLALLAGAAVSFGWMMLPGVVLRRAVVAGAMATILAFLIWRTSLQIPVWHNDETLWIQAVAEEPSPWALGDLGSAYFDDGDTVGAVELYQRAIAMDPRYGYAHFNLGAAYLDLNRLNDALHEFRVAQELLPSFAPAYDGSGNALSLQGKLDEAIRDYRRVVQLSPDYVQGRHNLEVALARKRRQVPPANQSFPVAP